MCVLLMTLTQVTFCLQNAEVTQGATTNREQIKQVTENRGDDRSPAADVDNGLADRKLLCDIVARAEHSQLLS